jgi:arylsulfatase A-like enzyme
MRNVLAVGLGVFLMAGVAGVAGAAEGQRPNILLAIADDWSNGHASIFGAKWIETPNFDRVANEGVLFTNAFTRS